MKEKLQQINFDPTDIPEDVLRQMNAVKQAIDENGEPIPIPRDSPLGKYLLNRAKPLEDK